MQIVLNIWLGVVIILSFIKLKWGVALLMVYFILIPGFNIGIQGIGGGQNVIFFLMLIAYIFHNIKYGFKTDYYILSPFITLFLVMFIVIPFQNTMSIGTNILYWLKNVIDSIVFPLIIMNLMKQDNSAAQLFHKVIYGCIIVVLGYGMFQIAVLGGRVNPYTIYMNTFIGPDSDFEAYYASSESRLFGRISSVFLHPMNFAMFLGVAIIYLYHLTQHRKKMADVLLLLSAMIIALLCGVRSVVAALAVSFAFILLVSRKFKFVISIAGGAIILYIIMTLSPDLQKYLGSIVNSDKSSVGGSSIEMRLYQLEGAIDEMMANPLFGLGNQWSKYYMSLHGDHPICLAFESLVFIVLCNYGIIGIANYSFMIIKSFYINFKSKMVKSIDNDTRHILNTLLVFYLAYSIMTGDYGYLKYTLMFYVLTYSITKSEIKATYNQYKYEHKNYCTLPTAIPSHTRK